MSWVVHNGWDTCDLHLRLHTVSIGRDHIYRLAHQANQEVLGKGRPSVIGRRVDEGLRNHESSQQVSMAKLASMTDGNGLAPGCEVTGRVGLG